MSEKKPTGHRVCAVQNCFNRGYNSKNKFYRFPKDANRARIWAMKANREDLLEKINNLYKSQSICEIHFEERMFTSSFHTRLGTTAIPTLFPSLEGTYRTDHSYSAPPLQLPEKIQVFDGKVLVSIGVPPAQIDIVKNSKKIGESSRDWNIKEKRNCTGASDISWGHFEDRRIYDTFSTPKKVKLEECLSQVESTSCSASVASIGSPYLSPIKEEIIEDISVDDPFDSNVEEIPKDSTKMYKEETLEKDIAYLKQENIPDINNCTALISSSQTQNHCNTPNNSFCNYVLSRLNEMPPEEAQQKRKRMLFVLEDIG